MPRLESMIEALWVTVEPYLRLYVTTAGSFRAAQEQHRALLACLRGGDAEAAGEVLRRHLGDTEEIVASGIATADA
jgi:DNA-binding GntR family transcriptional regulator